MRRLPPRLIADLVKIVSMEMIAFYVLWTALRKLYNINILDFSTMYGKVFAVGVTLTTFLGLYYTLSSASRIRSIGNKVVFGQDATGI